MNAYTLRIDAVDGITRERISQFVKKHEEYLVVYEVAKETGKHHYQGYVKTDVKHQAYQKRVIAAFPEVVTKGQRGGRGLYSAGKVGDLSAYARYLMKGTIDAPPDVVCSATQLDIPTLWASSQQAEANKARKNTDGCDKNQDIVERARQHFTMLPWDTDRSERAKQRDVCEWLLSDLLERGKKPDYYLVRKYIIAVLCKIDTNSFAYTVESIIEKL